MLQHAEGRATLSSVNVSQRTPLHLAAGLGHDGVVAAMLQHAEGRMAVSIVDRAGQDTVGCGRVQRSLWHGGCHAATHSTFAIFERHAILR